MIDERREAEVKPDEDVVKTSNGHVHYFTPFDVDRKDLRKGDSTSSTKAQCSSMDTIYSSRDVEVVPVREEFEPISGEMDDFVHNVIVTNASVDLPYHSVDDIAVNKTNLDTLAEDALDCVETHGLASPAMSACVSPASSNGGIYSVSYLFFTICMDMCFAPYC